MRYPTALVAPTPRARLTALTVALAAALLAAAPAVASAKQDVTIPMDDGVEIGATLYVPDGTPPTGGWPAIAFLHGLSGNRTQMNDIAERFGFAGKDYVVLTFDARGHGESGGLVGIDGPREVADTRAVFQWLAARPDVADRSIGAWGISYGGGAIWNSLAAGVPWAAVEVVETWTDLYSALLPGGLLKSGLVAGLAGSIPDARKSPEFARAQADAFASDAASEVRAFALARSSISRLGEREDAGLHDAGAARLPVRHRPGHARVREARAVRSASTSASTGTHRRPSRRRTPPRCCGREGSGSTGSSAASATGSTPTSGPSCSRTPPARAYGRTRHRRGRHSPRSCFPARRR